MPRLETEARPADWLGPDPGPRIRRMVAMMLRLALGISLLGAGLARYLGARQTNQVPGMTMMLGSFEFLTGLGYVQIALGLALILGFALTFASLGSCLMLLAIPIFQMILEVANRGLGPGLDDPYLTMTTQMLPMLMVPAVLMLWLSPVANHPWSIDALISARDRDSRAIRPPVIVIGPETTPPGPTSTPE